MAAALSFLNANHADAFAEAARRSKKLHAGWVHPPTSAEGVIKLAARRAGPSDFGYMIHDYPSAALAGYIEITSIVRGPFQSGYLGYYMFSGYEGRGYMKWALV